MFFEDYPIDFKVFARMVSRHSFCEVLSRPALRDFDMCCGGDRSLALKIHDFRNTEGLAMVQIRYRGGFETKNEAFT